MEPSYSTTSSTPQSSCVLGPSMPPPRTSDVRYSPVRPLTRQQSFPPTSDRVDTTSFLHMVLIPMALRLRTSSNPVRGVTRIASPRLRMFSLENVGGADLCGLLDIHPSSTSLFFYMYMYHPRLISADNGSLLAFMECPKFCQDDLALIIPNYQIGRAHV